LFCIIDGDRIGDDHYDVLASGYLELHGEEQFRKLKIIKDHMDDPQDEAILDVGCGIGLSNDVFDCRVVGVDPSREMLLQARSHGLNSNKKKMGDYIQARAENLPIKDKSFNNLVSVTAVHNFENPEVGLKEMRRICGSRAAITIMKKTKYLERLKEMIQKGFKIIELIEEDKDLIIICEPL
jgi:ubiquinone/menaquinone biosynthesis C-methylase UbiE